MDKSVTDVINDFRLRVLFIKRMVARFPNSTEDVFATILGACFILLEQNQPEKLRVLADLLVVLIDGDREIWVSSKPPEDIDKSSRDN